MITSTSNKQVRLAAGLRDKAKVRREEGLFLAEGLRMCRELRPEETRQVFVTAAFKTQAENARWLRDYPWEEVSDQVMDYMAGTKTPQGIIALARQKSWSLGEILKGDGRPACLMVLETLQDPGNLGTILRAGEGAGITGVVMNRDTADMYNPKVIRSTMGSLLRVPFVYADSLKDAVGEMKQAGVCVFAAHLKGQEDYDREDYRGPSAFLIGNEANGLTEETASLADRLVKIPMCGKVESLNAAVAASVLMFEAARQRRGMRGI